MKIIFRASALLAVFLASCVAAGVHLRTEAVKPADVSGTYRLYLYGCRHAQDLENMALLVDEQAPETFELFATPTSYRVLEHLPAAEAFRRASAFLACSAHDRGRTVTRRIVSDDGRAIAYEVKPLYDRLEFGNDEALWSVYSRSGSRVTVHLRLDPAVERALQSRDMPAAMPDRP
jgi:hypothetical protein